VLTGSRPSLHVQACPSACMACRRVGVPRHGLNPVFVTEVEQVVPVLADAGPLSHPHRSAAIENRPSFRTLAPDALRHPVQGS